MSLGYSGPLTITAIGDLEDTPDEVLRALSSTGILVKEVACGLQSVLQAVLDWERNNPPPATIMLISDYLGVGAFTYPLCGLQEEGYNILMAYPHTLPRRPPGLVTCAEWLWEPFLTTAMDSQETRRPEKKCSEDAFICQSCKCDFAGQSFEMFIDHIRGRDHVVKTKKPWPPKLVKPYKDRVEPSLPMSAATLPTDLRDDKQFFIDHPGAVPITTNQGEELRKLIGSPIYIECSSKTQQNVKAVFDTAIKVMLQPPKQKKKKKNKNRCVFL